MALSDAALMEVQFRSVFLTSQNHRATADFYRDIALLPLEAVGEGGAYTYWRLDRNGMQLAIHDAEAFAAYAHPSHRESNLTHLYFKIDNYAAFLAHLAERGVTPFLTDEVTITVVDPDGRKVMFGTA